MRTLSLGLGLLLSLLFLANCQTTDETPAAANRLSAPGANVVLITIDTLRADHLSADPIGAPEAWRVETPHMDALAAEGVLFANAATTVPFTLPAHSSIMTGHYPPSHGVRENVGYSLDERLPTLAEELKAAGYTTAAFVSAFVLDSRWGIGRGFDVYFDQFQVANTNQINLGEVQRDGAETLAVSLDWLDAYLADSATPNATPSSSAPFFLWLHLFDPHEPYTPAEPYKSQYPDHPYGAEVAYTDGLIGELRDGLRERGVLDNTAIVLTGDHGEGLGEHGESFHGYYVYDSTIRVPYILRLPPASEDAARHARGRFVHEAVSHVDLMPTLLELLGLDIPEAVHGRSLLPFLDNSGSTSWNDGEEKRTVYSESFYALYHYGWSPLRTLRDDTLKFIEAPRPEIFEIARGESENLLRERRSEARDLDQRLEALAAEIERPAEDEVQPDLDEETLRQLEALGYLAGRGHFDEDSTTHNADGSPRADPKDKIALHQAIMWAQTFIGRGQDDEAERRLNNALAEDDGLIEAHQMLGNIASREEDFEAAAGHFRRALELQPEHKVALYGLATAYKKMGQDDEALLGFQRLQSLAPHDSKAVIAMTGIYFRQGRLDQALALLEEATSQPDLARIPTRLHSQHGELLLRMGRLEEAANQLRLAIAKNPRSPTPFFHLAKIAEGEGKRDDAIELYEAALARRPNLYPALVELARLYGQRRDPERGDLEKQRQLYESALERDPDFIRGYFGLARWLLDNSDGDLPRAEELVREGLRRDTRNLTLGAGYPLLADILERMGRSNEARRVLADGRGRRR